MKKIAYLILTHSDEIHFEKLINSLNKDCDFYIHVDKKTNIIPFKNVTNKNQNIFFLENRVSVSWAGISMIDAQNLLLEEALKKKEKYSHFVFLSGSCFPIKNNEYILNYFTVSPNKEFIKYIDMRESKNHYIKHIENKWFKEPLFYSNFLLVKLIDKVLRRILNSLSLKNNWNKSMVPYFGSQWIAITPDCASYIINFQKKNPWFRKMNKYTFSPDEHYYHTIIGNSEYRFNSDGLQIFTGRGTYKLANFHLIDSSLSKWFTIDDWNEIKTSEKIFARKFSSSSSNTIISKIIKEIL